jgi:hypothetical protein
MDRRLCVDDVQAWIAAIVYKSPNTVQRLAHSHSQTQGSSHVLRAHAGLVQGRLVG